MEPGDGTLVISARHVLVHGAPACGDDFRMLALTLARLTQGSVASTRCQASDAQARLVDVDISLATKVPLRVSNAIFGFGLPSTAEDDDAATGIPRGVGRSNAGRPRAPGDTTDKTWALADGFFPSLSACIERGPELEETFTQETGLSVLMSRCQPAPFSGPAGAFIFRVDGDGLSRRALRELQLRFDNARIDERFLAAMTSAVSAASGSKDDASRARVSVVRSVIGATAGHVLYWSERVLDVRPLSLTFDNGLADDTECRSELAEARQAFARAGVSLFASGCLPTDDLASSDTRSKSHLAIAVETSQAVNISFSAAGAFPDYESCARFRASAPDGSGERPICLQNDGASSGYVAFRVEGRVGAL